MARALTGIVSSDKNHKTIVVTVTTDKVHPIYKKKYVSTKHYQAHDEKSQAKLGDEVTIVETRPISATKRFKLGAVINTAKIQHQEEREEI